MCRNIKTLFNFDPPATEEEIRASALQFARKLSGFNRPSQANAAAFTPTAMKAVIGVGAPWYTSGIHEWNGAAPTLNSTPTSNSAEPISASDVLPVPEATVSAMPASFNVPA